MRTVHYMYGPYGHAYMYMWWRFRWSDWKSIIWSLALADSNEKFINNSAKFGKYIFRWVLSIFGQFSESLALAQKQEVHINNWTNHLTFWQIWATCYMNCSIQFKIQEQEIPAYINNNWIFYNASGNEKNPCFGDLWVKQTFSVDKRKKM
jgi:hypothetical protein